MTRSFPASFSLKPILIVAISIFTAGSASGQTTAARPDRGVMPNGSYSVSDIENISLQNGNMNLGIPLAALPPVAGSKLSWAIKAHYNSKLWNVNRTELMGQRADGSNVNYVVDTPQLSEVGGWRISGQYEIEIRDARSDFDYQAPPVADEPDYSLLVNYNWYRVVLRMPDGAEHELRPLDYAPFVGGKSFLYGYYTDTPYTRGTMRYYSFDGSYLYATVTSEGNWTVYLPDGTKVVQTPDGIQRIQDTNGNKIKIFTDTNGTHYQDEQTGREIRDFYDPAANNGQGQRRVYYKTVGGAELHIDINFGQTTVQGQVYKVKDWIPFQFSPTPCNRHSEINTEIPVIREIVLPQTEFGVTRKFSFTYSSDTTETASSLGVRFSCSESPQTYVRTASKGWGFLSRVETPSGAKIDYTYFLDSYHLPMDTDELAKVYLTQKKLIHDGTEDIWGYLVTDHASVVTNPDGSTVTESKYTHLPGMGSAFGKSGLVYRTVQPFTKIERHWTNLAFSGASIVSPNGNVDFNGVVDFEYTTLLDAAGTNLKMSAKAFQHDYNGNVLQTTEYDWFDPALVSRDAQGVPTGVPGSAVVLRTVNNSYYNPASTSTSGNVYAKRNLSTATPLILNAPQQTTVGPAITQFIYDGLGYGNAPTVGNLTSQSVWDDFASAWVTSSQVYGAYGNLVTKTDPRGKVTQFYFDDSTHALPNRVVVDPQNGTGTQTTTTAFDYYTGVVTSQTDANGNTSTIDYTNQLLGSVDPFGRPGIGYGPTVFAGGVNQRQRVTTTYVDSARQVIAASDLNSENDKLLKTRTTSDMLGRVTLSEQTEDGTNYTISSRKVYEQMGKITYSSNPARAAAASTDGWTRTTTDTAGRVIEVATFGGAAQPAATGYTNGTGKVTTSYEADFTTVSDQADKVRRSMVNALGQLLRIDEPDTSNNLGSTASPVQPTNYTYSVLGSLLTVTQGAQTRSFVYDSLSRLRTATNPESGTNSYTYDENGNLLTKTDARGVTSTYVYDALNRNTTVNYSDTTTINPDITRIYDTGTNGKGRLRESYAGGTETVGATVEHTKILSYDALGRPLDQRQRFKTASVWSAEYQAVRVYHLAGAVSSQTYPSGRTVSYAYDNSGRTSSLSGNLGDGTNRTYATGITYAAMGGMTNEQFGTDTALYNKSFYNSRGQLAEIRVGAYHATEGSWWNRGAIINHYSNQCWGACNGSGMTDNNGNLKKQDVYIPLNDQISSYTMWTQQYDYDNLNRLQRVKELNSGSTTLWQQEYGYDRYGNRTIHQTNTWGAGINKKDFTVNTANNRLGVPGGQTGTMAYDAAGNLTTDTYSGTGVTRAYDAENRMTSETQASSYLAGVYTYNAAGQRVRRKVNGLETWQVYGFEGELLAEYAVNAAPTSPQKEYGYRNGQLLITAGPSEVFVSSLSWTSATNGWGPVERNTSNGESSGGDGTTIRLNGVAYGSGLGVHADSDVRFSLAGQYATFTSDLGVDDEVGGNGSVKFQVWADGALLYDSGVMYASSATQTVNVNVAGKNELRLLVTNGGDNYNYDHADWANARLIKPGTTADIQWLVADQLGTPRMVFDKTGALATTKRHDYLPFGEELFAGQGVRSTGLGYIGDNVRQKFTAKERDIETGLDYFEARYYASTQGRFTSPDPLQASAKRRNPQTWNRYTYGLNNPLRYTDPDGEEAVDENSIAYTRTTIRTTEVVVQERGGGEIVREARVTVTESQTEYIGEFGDVLQTDPIQTSATAADTGNGVLNYSQDQRDKMANAAQNIVAVSREKGFDATIALGIAQTETHMTTLLSKETSAAKKTHINPMQLSGTSGIKPTTDLRGNIAGAIDVYNRGAGTGLNASLQLYNNEAGKVAYAATAERHINQIRSSVRTSTVSNQRPALFGFPTRPQ